MKKYFITGIIILLPLAVTIGLVGFTVNLLTKPFMGWVSDFFELHDLLPERILFFSREQIIQFVAQILVLVWLFVSTLLLGMIARWFFFKAIIEYFDALLLKIPLVNKIYKTTQEIIKTLFANDKNSFKQVVLAPFPNKQTFTLGLVSCEAPAFCSKACNMELITVFVMTAPNPTTGYLMMFPKSELIYIEMKVEDAIKYIISCGILLPEETEK